MSKYVTVSLLSQPPLMQEFTEDMEGLVQKMESYLQENLDYVLPDKPDIIVVPEACDRYPLFTMEQRKAYYRYRGNRIRDFYRGIARKHSCYIAYSACRYLSGEERYPYRNSTQLIGRDGEIVGIYDKNHLVPSELENGEIAYGTQAPVFELDFGRVCCAICFDLNFDELKMRYAGQEPDLILFSSFYHGGMKQEEWAYCCGAYFAGAICRDQSRILNPFGETVAASTNYYSYITGRINLDYVLVHIDRNGEKFRAAKKKYGEKLMIHDPGHIGAVLLTYEAEDRTIMDVVREFDIMLLKDYFAECRRHRSEHIETGSGKRREEFPAEN